MDIEALSTGRKSMGHTTLTCDGQLSSEIFLAKCQTPTALITVTTGIFDSTDLSGKQREVGKAKCGER